ncbi:MAG: hypothetical protein V3T30_05975 [Thermodesulfobacteriota bacterium]
MSVEVVVDLEAGFKISSPNYGYLIITSLGLPENIGIPIDRHVQIGSSTLTLPSIDQKYEALADEVRRLSDNLELLHIIGPSRFELRESKNRRKKIDEISALCGWNKNYQECNEEEKEARNNFVWLIKREHDFELRYFKK